jgi:hypothetical protein
MEEETFVEKCIVVEYKFLIQVQENPVFLKMEEEIFVEIWRILLVYKD